MIYKNTFQPKTALTFMLITSLVVTASNLRAESKPLTRVGDPETSELGWWDKIKVNISTTWNSPTRDLYIPLNTWHNRYMYDKDKTDSYNERPWGIGYGVSRFDADGDWHSIYAMEFQDSHNKVEPIIGYGYQKNGYFGARQDWRIGLGFTAGITMRDDYNYIPIPLPLPLFSVEYKKLAIQSTYIPGSYNNGNVLFTWARWQF